MATTFTSKQTSNQSMIKDYYHHHESLSRYIRTRVNNADDAEDLVQDVFLRLLEYKGEIQAEGTKNLAFAIACNVVNDYLRHQYVKKGVHERMMIADSALSNETEEEVIGRDLIRLERRSLESMPPQRRMIYFMRIHEGKSNREIAESLNISTRTAENHFYIGIRQMRECFMAAM